METERCGREPSPRGRVRAGFRRSSIGCSRLLLGGSRRLALGYALGSRLHLLGDPLSPGWLALAQRRLVLARALKTGRWARVRITPQSRTMCRWLLCGSEVLERAFGNKGLAHQRHGPWPGFLPVPQASAFHRRQEPALLTVFVSAFLATHARVSSQRASWGEPGTQPVEPQVPLLYSQWLCADTCLNLPSQNRELTRPPHCGTGGHTHTVV